MSEIHEDWIYSVQELHANLGASESDICLAMPVRKIGRYSFVHGSDVIQWLRAAA